MTEKSVIDETIRKWALENGLSAEILQMLVESGWKSTEEIAADFCEHDIPAELPQRFHTRLLNAVKALREPQEDAMPPLVFDGQDASATGIKVIADKQEGPTEPHVIIHNHFHYVEWRRRPSVYEEIWWPRWG
jgi:lambda repressor-like predicted transcriptional regulator